MLRARATNGAYAPRRRDFEAEPQSFWGYWEAQRASAMSNLV